MYKFSLFLMLLFSSSAIAQLSRPVSEESPVLADGVEYGYAIKNVSTREVNNKNFSRFEVTLYATNKSDCSRVVLFGKSLDESENDLKVLAKYDCTNATGARLTTKTGEINAKPMFVTARVNTRDKQGKEVQENQKVQIGYYLGVSETIENNVIFIVPLDTKPDVKVRILNHPSSL